MKHSTKIIETSIVLVILYSLFTHFLELEFDTLDQSSGFFLWSERVVAVIFTIEYVVRWIASRSWRYPFRALAIIDFLAVLPFYAGFFVDLRSLRIVRALRVLRLFKLYRYSSAAQSLRDAFLRVRHEFAVMGFAVFTLMWLCTVAIFELERRQQPEAFGKLSDAAWFTVVTLTTVGYGDKVPVTAGGRCTAAFMMIAGMGLFGTFISLIGGAFVEELRKRRIKRHEFDPASLLKAIETGELKVSPEAAEHLRLGCKLMVGGHP